MNLLIWQAKLIGDVLSHQHVGVRILSKHELQPLQLLLSISSPHSLLLGLGSFFLLFTFLLVRTVA